MKRIFSLIIVMILALALVSCNDKKVSNDEVKVYFYIYRNAYKMEETKPDIVKHEIFKKGEHIEEPEEPVRAGYIFKGWYKDVTYRNLWNFEEDVLEKNVALFAKWDPETYKINLELNEGEFTERSRFDGLYDEEGNPYYLYVSGVAQPLHIPSRLGYKFLGWYKTEVYKIGEKQETSVDRSISEETTYYAHWEKLTIVVTFDTNLPTSNPEKIGGTRFDYGEPIDLPIIEDSEGIYEFIGWNTRKDGSGVFLVNGEPFELEQTTKLYAQWELK